MKKVDLILHPVRFRILQALAGVTLTTQEIADRLPDVPKSSIYRHLKSLLDGEMIAVMETRLVNGIQEKSYGLKERPYLNADDVAGLSAADHVRYFTTYVMNLQREFAEYVQALEAETGTVDLLAERVGYTEVTFYASLAEMDQLHTDLNAAFAKVIGNEGDNGRFPRKIAIITHPLKRVAGS
jgi:DNA-binding transcriptional ArsR family regulator